MAEIPIPTAVSNRVIRITHELWAPGQITHRMRSGAIDGPLVRGTPRWRGLIEFSRWAAFGDDDDVDAVAAMDLFIALMSRPGNWCHMPWGGAPPAYRKPPDGYLAAITVSETEDAGFAVRRSAGTGAFQVGDWMNIHGRLGIVREADDPTGAGDRDQAGLRTIPDLATYPNVAGVGTPVYGGTHMMMQLSHDNDATISSPRTAHYGGPWVFAWEEYLEV